jgi:SAM-dependent methyltransferase
VTPRLRKWLFETLYKNRYLYRFASTVPFAGQWRVWQRLVLPRLYGHGVLEIGCGLGDLLADMLAKGYDCRAVEHSPQMVAAARATLRKRKVGQPTWIIQGSAQNLPFSDNTFDTVVSTFPSDYIYDPMTIAEVARVLRPGGRVIVILGANLLAIGFLQPLLVLIHILVYGPGTLLTLRKHRKSDQETPLATEKIHFTKDDDDIGITSEELPASWFGSLIPLERFGLQSRSECVRSRRWEASLVIGEKTAEAGLESPFTEK